MSSAEPTSFSLSTAVDWPARRAAVLWAALTLAGVGATALVGAAAVVSPILALTGVAGIIFVVVAFRSLAAGVALFVVVSFFENMFTSPGQEISIAKLTGTTLVLSWIVQIVDRRKGAPLLVRRHPLLAYAAIVLVGWYFASMLWAEDAGIASFISFRLAQAVLLMFVVFSALAETRQLRWFLWAYVAGASLTAVVGLAGGFGDDSARYGGIERLSGGVGDPNEFAAYVLPALVLTAFLLPTVASPLLRWVLVSCAGVTGLALFLAQSRGGLVALGVVVLAALVLAGPVRAHALALILVAGALGVGYYVVVAPPEEAARLTNFSAEGSAGRSDLWRIALRMASDHPLVGVGAGNYQVVAPLYATGTIDLIEVGRVVDEPQVTHNSYLNVLTELGVPGLLLFGAIVLGALATGVSSIRALARTEDRQTELLARGIVIGVIGMLAAFAFISAQYEKQLWLLLGAAAALSSLVPSRAARPRV